MKKYLKLLLVIIIFMFLGGICYRIFIDNSKDNTPKNIVKEIKKEKKQEKNNYPSYNGYLKVNGTKLVNEKDEEFVLKGVSSHGVQWFYDLYTKDNFKSLKEDWNTNVFRIAMYTKEGGYIDDSSVKDKVIKMVDELIELDMYVIVDWHILSDNNPTTYTNASKRFFDEISKKYKDKPNVIYEICNEPNGDTSFDDINKYANEVIPVIRKNSPKSLVIVGTPTWSQDVDRVVKLGFENIMYALHFYSGTHTEDLRNKARSALNNNTPIIVSEFGVSDASGNGGIYFDETDKWIKFLKENNISIISWSLSNKNETSAILKENTNELKDENLTSTGKYLKDLFKNY
ncbi:MAG: glycoside hydrolase family 5 protein [Bacilli bacterium]|nr:glycoside hydrolase family 5 protein [Bacilli bacterium]